MDLLSRSGSNPFFKTPATGATPKVSQPKAVAETAATRFSASSNPLFQSAGMVTPKIAEGSSMWVSQGNGSFIEGRTIAIA